MLSFSPKNLIIITGPSGVGKTTVALELLERHKNIKRVVTYTTRKKRKGEIDGKDYNFVTLKKFEIMKKAGEFFEWARVYENYYGNSLKDLKKLCEKNKYCLMVLDIQGAEKIKKEFKKNIGIFLTVNFSELAKRIKARGKMFRRDFETRQNIAKQEIKKAKQFDFIVENKEGRVDETVEKIEKILKI